MSGDIAAKLARGRAGKRWRSLRLHAPEPGSLPVSVVLGLCFSAAVWRRFDGRRARAELESLLGAQRDDGFIGHTIFWDTPLNRRQRLTYNVLAHDAPMTASIQPPAMAWAWRIAVGDPGAVPAIARQVDWLAEHRDLDGDGLMWIVQPDESGLDASPQLDAIWRGHADGLPGFVLLRRNRALGYDLRRIAEVGGPVCCEVLTNVLYALSRLALGRASLTGAIVERMYDERAGLFRPIARPRPERNPTVTWAALSPLVLPDLPEEIGRRLIEERLLDPERFCLPVPSPSVPVNGRSFSRRESTLGIRRYWRRPTWINGAWLLWLGLVRLGYTAAAAPLSTRLGEAVAAAGLREYHDPYTGRGMGASDFGWSSLILEMLDPDPRARDSFLGARQLERPRSLVGLACHHCRHHDPAGRDSDAGMPEALNVQGMRRGLVRLLFFAALVVVVIVTVPGLGSIRGRLAHANPGWLVLAGCYRLASALSYVVLFRAIFAPRMPVRASYRIGMSEVGANALAPAGGASGLAIGDWVLHREARPWSWLVERTAEFFVFTSAFNVGAVAVLGWLGAAGVFTSGVSPLFSLAPAVAATVAIGVALALIPRLAGLDAKQRRRRVHS